MQRTITRAATGLAAAALLVAAVPAAAQQGGHAAHSPAMPTSGFRAELIRDIEQLEAEVPRAGRSHDRQVRVAAGRRRAFGQRSVHAHRRRELHDPDRAGPPAARGVPRRGPAGDHVQARRARKVTDPERVKAELQHAFMHAKHTIAGIQDSQLDETVTLFGMDLTKRAALNLLVNHMHEHLGQSIAYARTNGVVPPWSAGTGN